MRMPRWFYAVVALILEAVATRRDRQIRFLKAQIEILRGKVPGNRVIVDPADRLHLLKLGQELDHQVKDILHLVSIKTYRHWVRSQQRGEMPRRVGRPPLAAELRDLICRLARENVGWGLGRIIGELRKLQVAVSRHTVRRVLSAEGLFPDPERVGGRAVTETSWRKFIALHMNTIVACDFLSKTVLTPLGRQTAYLLMFIHLESRKVFVSPPTCHPIESWVVQQARNLSQWLDEQGIEARFLLHDRDCKFALRFDACFEAAGGGIIRTPVAAPNANAFCESWISRFKAECLDHFICFGLGHLNHIAQTFMRFYNQHRPHQGKGNRTLQLASEPPSQQVTSPRGAVCKHAFLAGLLNHYYREAA